MAAASDETAVAEILLATWDPLEARGVDAEPEHEYLHEATRVLALLRIGTDQRELAAHLAAERKALTTNDKAGRDQAAAVAIIDWWTATGGA